MPGFNSRTTSAASSVAIALNKALIRQNLNNVWTKQFKHSYSAGDSRVTTTFNTIMQAPCTEYGAVRMHIVNWEATPASVTGALIAATNTATSLAEKSTPSTGTNTVTNDGSTGWQTVTWNGSATPTLPAFGADTTLPGYLVSDWIPLTSQTPIDGSVLPYIIGRILMNGTTFTNLNHSTDAVAKVKDSALYAETFIWTGDGIAVPANFSGGSNQSVTPIIGYEFMSSKRVMKVLCVGDSITQGVNNTAGVNIAHNSWVQKAADLLYAQGIPVNMINCGYSGATTTQIAAFGKVAIQTHLPAVVFYPPFSPNDGTPTQAIIDTQYRRALDFANFALDNGVLPVFDFLAPKDYSATDDAFRKQLITRCKASGILVCDMTTATGDGATPERYKTGLDSDGTHPNDAGYTAMAPVAVSTVSDIYTQNFAT